MNFVAVYKITLDSNHSDVGRLTLHVFSCLLTCGLFYNLEMSNCKQVLWVDPSQQPNTHTATLSLPASRTEERTGGTKGRKLVG